jgi:hypothetical protein
MELAPPAERFPAGPRLAGPASSNGEEHMTRAKMAVAAATFASASLLSFGWSAQGVSLAVDAAQAAPRHEAMHRHYRHHYGANPVAAGADVAAGAAGALAAGAIGTAGAIAAAPFGGPYYGNGYYSSSTWGDYDCGPNRPGCRPYAERWAH